jgi:myo-inositol-1(or 4)-monophosphatase
LRARPTYGFLGEESIEKKGTDGAHRWIVDPLDGTTNFLHGIPHFAVSIALERNNEIVAGVIYNPAPTSSTRRSAAAARFSMTAALRVAGRKAMSDAVIGTGVPHLGRGHHGKFLVELRHVMGECAGIRRMGAAALDLAYVAAGRLDGFWEKPLEPWDMAAGIILIREAGGFVSDTVRRNRHVRHPVIAAGNEYMLKGRSGPGAKAGS